MLRVQQCSVGLMQFIESLTDRTPLFSAEVAAGAAAASFAARPGCVAFPVTDGEESVLGLVERTAVARAVADGQADRPIGELMLPSALALPGALTAREALGLVLAQPDKPDVFAVMDGRQCLGVCTLRALVEAVTAQPPPASRSAELDRAAVVELIVEETHTCYLGDRGHRHAWGYGCGTCPACALRQAGYEEWIEAGRPALAQVPGGIGR